MKFLSTLKTYALAIVGAALGAALIVLRVLLSRNSKLRQKVEKQDANLKHQRKVIEADIAVNEQEDIRLKEVRDEIDQNKPPKELKDPNDWGDK